MNQDTERARRVLVAFIVFMAVLFGIAALVDANRTYDDACDLPDRLEASTSEGHQCFPVPEGVDP